MNALPPLDMGRLQPPVSAHAQSPQSPQAPSRANSTRTPTSPQTLAVPVVVHHRPRSVSSMALQGSAALPLPVTASRSPSVRSSQSVHIVPVSPDNDAMSIHEVRITVPPLQGALVGRVSNHRARFDAFAVLVSAAVGAPGAFYTAVAIVTVWLAIGQPMGWGTTWQLIMNTISSVITFWMVFVLQASQNRDTRAQQLQFMDLRNAVAEQQEQIGTLQKTVQDLVQALKDAEVRR